MTAGKSESSSSSTNRKRVRERRMLFEEAASWRKRDSLCLLRPAAAAAAAVASTAAAPKQDSNGKMVAKQLLATVVLFFAVILLEAASQHKVAALRITSIEVPSAVMNSSQVTLACNYELQGDQLYSVKWYKNYVEFYRFQPNGFQQQQQQQLAGQMQPPMAAASASGSQQIGQDAPNSKQEFELEGINLNLLKSNATHVHLNRATLSSEGTYKCEISADSPSFATISSERQMKVYVLPKQKPSIVDNSLSTVFEPNQQQQQQPQFGRHYQLSLNPNDQVNLTCVSAPSFPAAKLSWFINGLPISNTSKWLQHHHHQQHHSNPSSRSQQQQQQPSVAVESRLTLAFRLQPNQFAQFNQPDLNGNHPQRQSMLQFRCLAELSVEFGAETKVALAGGNRAPLKKRNRDQDSSQEPQAEPWLITRPDQTDHLRPINSGGQSLFVTAAAAATATATSNSAGRQLARGDSVRPLVAGNQTIMRQQANVAGPSSQLIYTNKQLRLRAEQIDQRLRLARPNELRPPLIEARSQVLDYSELDDDDTENNTNHSSKSAHDDDSASDEENDHSSVSSTEGASSKQSAARDYELNELILFSCQPQPPQIPNSNSQLKSQVQFKWFINNKEINLNHVNHFDGSQFLYLPADQQQQQQQQQNNRSLKRPKQMVANSRFSEGSKLRENLLIELTSSLFQLKELDLKCRTWIEQPLTEFDAILMANLAGQYHSSSGGGGGGSQFIEAEQTSTNNGDTSASSKFGPWLLKGTSQQQQQQHRRNQQQLLKLQQKQPANSAASSSKTNNRLLLTLSILFYYVVSLCGRRRRHFRSLH